MKKMFAMLLCLAILALGTGAALAEGTTLSVTGNGTVLVESDLAIVTVGVQETSKDVLEAQSTVNEKIAAIKQALLDTGVEESEINTDSINIYANYDYSDNTEVIVGYTARNSLSVRTTDMDNVGSLIDAAFAAGANTLDNVQFTVQDDTQAREQALTMAVEDARRKADVLASAAGLQVASIERISEGGVSVYDSMRNYAADTVMAAEESGGAGTLVQAALVSVDATVSMEFELQ
ncbi:MAG TPA: SIMPL domain-containing protein [Candidatus Pullichristensenella excrementipullorum]|nr:SIMPL domain-containing protein [Candidatus Pullichristensenella excrementipullorum]